MRNPLCNFCPANGITGGLKSLGLFCRRVRRHPSNPLLLFPVNKDYHWEIIPMKPIGGSLGPPHRRDRGYHSQYPLSQLKKKYHGKIIVLNSAMAAFFLLCYGPKNCFYYQRSSLKRRGGGAVGNYFFVLQLFNFDPIMAGIGFKVLTPQTREPWRPRRTKLFRSQPTKTNSL